MPENLDSIITIIARWLIYLDHHPIRSIFIVGAIFWGIRMISSVPVEIIHKEPKE